MEVHRCRFVRYPPSTINAVAFSHSHITKGQKTASPRLAIGRANGDIEIWNPLRGSWLQETIIRGGQDRSVDGLVWIQDPNEEVQGKTYIGKSRLFSIGYTTTVTEWDLEKGIPLRQASGNHGEIWCLAAQPSVPQTKVQTNGDTQGHWQGQNLITGCTDGALVLYSTKDNGFELQKVLVRPSAKKAKIISVAFQDRNIVVAGCSDSTIRLYDIRNGSSVRSMTLGSGPKGGPKEIIVWSVKVLNNGNIISGDSSGELKIWDGKTYTLMQRIKSHRQDVLSLATSHDGLTILSGGMDRRTVIYKPSGKGGKRWSEVSHRRFHDHDVKTMASFEGQGLSVVISGGPDASPKVIPLGQYGFENQRSLPFLPQESTLRSASRKRLVMSWWDREVHIWRLSQPSKSSSGEQDEEPAKNRRLVAKVLIKGEANISSAALSDDGRVLAVSTISDIKVFQLRHRKEDEGSGLKVSKISVSHSFMTGARLLQFSPDSKWLSIIRPDSNVALARITSQTASSSIIIQPQLSRLSRLDRKIEKSITLGGLGTYDRTITQVAFSADSRILAVSDLAGYIDTFVLSGQEDLTQVPATESSENASSASSSDSDSSDDEEDAKPKQPKLVYGQHWTRNPVATSLPKLPSAPVILSFRPAKPSQTQMTNGITLHATRSNPHPISHELPTGEDRLFVMTATSDLFEFSVLKGSLTPWSRRNPTSTFPESFRKIRDQAKGAFWDLAAGKERIWIYGVGWLWMFDLSRDLPPPAPIVEAATSTIDIAGNSNGATSTSNKKRKRNHAASQKGTGAGSAIPDQELLTGISRKMKTTTHEESLVRYNIAPRLPDTMDVDEDDDEAAGAGAGAADGVEESSDALEKLRRGGGGNTDEEPKDDDMSEGGFKHEWHTFKYRPVLGMCLIGSSGVDVEGEIEDVDGDGDGNGQDRSLEVVIVERPIWEVDLPPRYYGDQEWEKKDF